MIESRIVRSVLLLLYYGFARKLPRSRWVFSLGARSVRAAICRGLFRHMGKDVNVETLAYFGTGEELVIGDRSGLGNNCRCVGPIHIGCDVMMGPDVVILTHNHRMDDVHRPMREQGYSPSETVTIEDDVWIGTRAIIMPGLTIGRGSVIGANAVVTRDVPRYAMVAGVPAKILKYRTEDPELLGRPGSTGVDE